MLQPGRAQVAAGYSLYSGSTLLVLTLGSGTGSHVFTLDTTVGEFVLTRPRVALPRRGTVLPPSCRLLLSLVQG